MLFVKLLSVILRMEPFFSLPFLKVSVIFSEKWYIFRDFFFIFHSVFVYRTVNLKRGFTFCFPISLICDLPSMIVVSAAYNASDLITVLCFSFLFRDIVFFMHLFQEFVPLFTVFGLFLHLLFDLVRRVG